MKPEGRFYSVQPVLPDGSKDGGLIHTDAGTPLEAAERALGSPLALHGKTPRAIVWVMAESFTPTMLTLYLPDEATASHRRQRTGL